MTFFKKCVCGLLSFSSISLWLPEPFVLPAAWTTSHRTNGNCIDGQTTLALWHCGRGWGSWSAIAHQPKLFVVRCIHTPYMKHDNIKLFIRWLVDVKRVFFFSFLLSSHCPKQRHHFLRGQRHTLLPINQWNIWHRFHFYTAMVPLADTQIFCVETT